ncbi:MAG: NfeD family protein [Spirochaetales bacterium]|nr:NfeD family protein [Spirochaetales bacterium]
MDVFINSYMMITIWISLMLIFIVFEAVTTSMVSVWFALGSLIALLLDLFGLKYGNIGIAAVYIQIVVFIIVSLVSLFTLAPLVKKKLKGEVIPTNKDALVGQVGLVHQSIGLGSVGRVKVGAQDWSALSEDGSEIPEGTKVEVVRVEGAKIIVKK